MYMYVYKKITPCFCYIADSFLSNYI